MLLHTSAEAWQRITPHVKKTRGRTTAAVAYVGREAPEILPLRAGDLLVCDASPQAVQMGSTSVAALRKYRQADVELVSLENLHAKVVTTRRRAFIGSANASANSRDVLYEAVVSITAPDLVADAKDFVQAAANVGRRIDKAMLDRLAKLKVRRSPQTSSSRPSAIIPRVVERLWVVTTEPGTWTKATDRVYADTKPVVRREASLLGRDADIWAIEWATDAQRLRKDDWVIEVSGAWASVPGRVMSIEPTTKKWSLVWLARPRKDTRSVSRSAFENLLGQCSYEVDALRPLRSQSTEAVLRHFRK